MANYAHPDALYVNYGNGSSTGYFAVAKWAASHAYTAGALIRQNTTPTVGYERVFICLVAGTSGASEPLWSTTQSTAGQKFTDNTAIWQECTGQPGVNGDTSNGPAPTPSNCPQWTVSAAAPLGLVIYDSGTSSLQICSTAGTSKSGTAPTFSATAGVTTTDGTATWTSLGLASSFGPFAAPHARLGVISLSTTYVWVQAGQAIYVGSSHAETQSGSIDIVPLGTISAPTYIYCVPTTSAPPTSITTGATVTSSGSSISLFDTNAQAGTIMGIAFTAHTGIYVGYEANTVVVFNCSFSVAGTSNIYLSNGANGAFPSIIEWYNTTVSFGNSLGGISLYSTIFTWRNTPSAIGGTSPGSLFSTTYGLSTILCEGVDFSGMSSGSILISNTASGRLTLKDCAIPSGMTVATPSGGARITTDVMRVGSSGINYILETHSGQGDQVTSTTVVRTGGASDGTTPVSHQVAPNASANIPFYGIPIDIWNTVTGANRTVTMYGVFNGAALPDANQLWFDVVYLGSATTPLGSNASSGNNPLNGASTAVSADTSTWDSKAPARANSSAYVVGQAISVSSNPGRVFFCTASGSSAASVPGGYASAVDGGSVTDGTATFRAGLRFVVAITISSPQPAQVGYLTVYPKYTNLQGAVSYIDPLPVLS